MSPSGSEQLNKVLAEFPLRNGDSWFLIENNWYQRWLQECKVNGQESFNPEALGPISNSSLVEASSQRLKERLLEGQDYVLLCKPAWTLLSQWYGSRGPEIERKVVQTQSSVFVEVYPLNLKIYLHDQSSSSSSPVVVPLTVSKAISMYEFKRNALKALEIYDLSGESDIRIGLMIDGIPTAQFNSEKSSTLTLDDAGICDGNTLVLERKSADGTWPLDYENNEKTSDQFDEINGDLDMPSIAGVADYGAKRPAALENEEPSREKYRYYGSVAMPPTTDSDSDELDVDERKIASSLLSDSASSNSNGIASSGPFLRSSSAQAESTGKKSGTGLVGLSNLGNTCFMNSALQCLSNTIPLTIFFLSGSYKRDINRTNPLGMHGAVAEAYGNLIRDIWTTSGYAVVPRDFKMTISRFCPQFSGYQQHDSQELLSFLLDGLHEDLNRIKKKPYVEIGDYDDQPDDAVAREMWRIHKQRNDSIIVDLFQGQFKSTLVCPECNYVSVTFDPFMYLSLPLPIVSEYSIRVIFLDPTKPILKLTVSLQSQSTILDLKQNLKSKFGILPERMVIAEWSHYSFNSFYRDSEKLFSHQSSHRDLFCFEMDEQIGPMEKLYNLKDESFWKFDYSFSATSTFASNHNPLDEDSVVNLRVQLRLQNSSSSTSFMSSSYSSSRFSDVFGVPLLMAVKQRIRRSELQTKILERIRHTFNEEKYEDLYLKLNIIPFTLSFQGSINQGNVDSEDPYLELKEDSLVNLDFSVEAKEALYGMGREASVFTGQEVEKNSQNSSIGRKSLSLDDCLNMFTSPETLGANDPWYCKKCKKHQEATKKFDIWALPDILVVHLKRFANSGRFSTHKIDWFVDFPLVDLDPSPFVKGIIMDRDESKHVKYDLFAISNHYGGLRSGHYTAFAKNKKTDEWYEFDDSRVSRVSPDSIKTSSAYVLFYERQKRGENGENEGEREQGKNSSPSHTSDSNSPRKFPGSSSSTSNESHL